LKSPEHREVKVVAVAGRSPGHYLKYLKFYTSLLVELAKVVTARPVVSTAEVLRDPDQIWKVPVEEPQTFVPA
jgi:hypothetical protein